MICSGAVARYCEAKASASVLLAALFSALAPDALIVGALLTMAAGYAAGALLARRST